MGDFHFQNKNFHPFFFFSSEKKPSVKMWRFHWYSRKQKYYFDMRNGNMVMHKWLLLLYVVNGGKKNNSSDKFESSTKNSWDSMENLISNETCIDNYWCLGVIIIEKSCFKIDLSVLWLCSFVTRDTSMDAQSFPVRFPFFRQYHCEPLST